MNLPCEVCAVGSLRSDYKEVYTVLMGLNTNTGWFYFLNG